MITAHHHIKTGIKGHLKAFIHVGKSLGVAMLVAGCAAASQTAEEAGRDDPYEQANRSVFAFNLGLDDYVLEPAAKALRTTPPQVQTALRNHVEWASMPKTAVNSALQGKGEKFPTSRWSTPRPADRRDRIQPPGSRCLAVRPLSFEF